MSEKKDINRREFLKAGTGTAAVGFALRGPAALARPARIVGANDRVRVAVIGVHGRGMNHVEGYAQVPNAELAALCDVDENVLAKRLGEIEKMGLAKPATEVDIRKLLEDKSLDAVSIATPNHWHALMGIWACQAGKDVYVEKPCCHNLWEGRQLVRAADKYGRMVQHGTQIRSSAAIRDGIQKLHEGLLGDVYMARGLCFKWRDTIGHAKVEPVPSGVHYDLWTGPAPLVEFTRNRFHYNWHWHWNYGNGDLGNQGVHQVDMARWGLGLKFPNKISAVGGHFMFDDDQQTPNTLNCAFEYAMPDGKPKLLEFEVRHWITNHEAQIGTPTLGDPTRSPRGQKSGPVVEDPNAIGNIYYGPKGYMATGDEDADTYATWFGPHQEPGPTAHEGGDHFANFIDCVRSRKKEDLHAPIEEGYTSAGMVHLANASYRLGRTIRFNPETEQAIDDPEAEKLLRDGDRGYRAPYVVPEEV